MLETYYLVGQRDSHLTHFYMVTKELKTNPDNHDEFDIDVCAYRLGESFGNVENFHARVSKSQQKVYFPSNIIFREQGIGLGSFLRDSVIEELLRKVPDYRVNALMFQQGPGGDNAEDNWERRERFYKSGGFNVFYPEGQQAYAAVNKVIELKVANNNERYLCKYAPDDVAKFVKKLVNDKYQYARRVDSLREANAQVENRFYECRRKLKFCRLLFASSTVLVGSIAYLMLVW